jgi:DNA gyrase inhibitor GyrI
VKLAETPARLVASIGVRGSYSRENFDEALAKLKAWLDTRPDLAPQGEPYAVYWNSPFVPGIFKHSEVHIPVAAKPAAPAAPAK